MSRDLNLLTPTLKSKLFVLENKALDAGILFIVTCTARTYLEQFALYAQGREKLEMVNHLRDNAGLGPIQERENKIVTWTLDSKHVINDKRTLSQAFDIVIVEKDRPIWDIKVNVNNNEIPDYLELAKIGKGLGLTAGAYFKHPDYPHFEEV